MKPYIDKQVQVGDRTFRTVVNRAGNIVFAVIDTRNGKQKGRILSP